jgi:hypothetical protein
MIRDTPMRDHTQECLLPENGVRFQYRNAVGGVTEREFVEGITAQWSNGAHDGRLIRAYYSADGT